ncbi:hypothetical protein GUJ93_ZPchr0012g20307 [Zizania palustris]|uniref:Uncharacterized protein n=1 Tax=Zizania palustris TaxID=103762 RepID=A0A8J5WSG5_ZIZPA|nr:hypothetical protein GUJ93_ZPchr0012g20307 [Zizania palustris]
MEAAAEAAPQATDRFYGGGDGDLSTDRKLITTSSGRRHESSHHSLPSLQLLQLAAIKVELRSKLHDINHFLKCKDSVKAKPDDILEKHVNFEPDDDIERVDNYSHPEKQLDVESVPEISTPSPECEISDMPESLFLCRAAYWLVGGV